MADETAVLEDPGERAFRHPPTRQDLEAFGPGPSSDDLERDVGLPRRPFHQTPAIAAIGEDASNERVAPARSLQRQLAAVAVLDIGAVDTHAEQAPIRVGQDVPLAVVDFLARLIALGAPF